MVYLSPYRYPVSRVHRVPGVRRSSEGVVKPVNKSLRQFREALVISPIFTCLLASIASLRRGASQRRDEGYTTETIAMIALLVVLALGVIGVVAAKVMARANGIDLNGR